MTRKDDIAELAMLRQIFDPETRRRDHEDWKATLYNESQALLSVSTAPKPGTFYVFPPGVVPITTQQQAYARVDVDGIKLGRTMMEAQLHHMAASAADDRLRQAKVHEPRDPWKLPEGWVWRKTSYSKWMLRRSDDSLCAIWKDVIGHRALGMPEAERLRVLVAARCAESKP